MARREKLMGIAEKLPKLQKMSAAPAPRIPAASASRRKVVPIETARARKRR
jgi:hypothetical protein